MAKYSITCKLREEEFWFTCPWWIVELRLATKWVPRSFSIFSAHDFRYACLRPGEPSYNLWMQWSSGEIWNLNACQMFGTTATVHHVVFIASKRLHLGACKFEVSFQSVGCGCCEFFAPDMSHLQVNMQTWQVAHHKNSQKGSPQHKCLGTQHQATNFFTHQVLVQGRMSSPSTSWDDSVEAAVTLLAIRRGRQQLSKDVRMTDT